MIHLFRWAVMIFVVWFFRKLWYYVPVYRARNKADRREVW